MLLDLYSLYSRLYQYFIVWFYLLIVSYHTRRGRVYGENSCTIIYFISMKAVNGYKNYFLFISNIRRGEKPQQFYYFFEPKVFVSLPRVCSSKKNWKLLTIYWHQTIRSFRKIFFGQWKSNLLFIYSFRTFYVGEFILLVINFFF